MQHFPAEESTFLFKGPVGNIEVLATPLKNSNVNAGTAIICHPHPLYGGTMTNKVVTTLAKSLQDLNFKTLRFNFRGVGKTEGRHAEGIGEVDDVVALAEWIRTLFPDDVLWLAGFSFGGYVATAAANRLPVSQLITVAPQVSRLKELSQLPTQIPWVLIQGEEDEIIPPAEVYAFAAAITPPPTLIRIPQAGHFFHSKLSDLRHAIESGLKKPRDDGFTRISK